jgi:hypothetical protein
MKSLMKRRTRFLWLGAGLVVVGLATAALVTIGPRNLWGMLLYDQREEGNLRVGDQAPDVLLTALDGSTRVRLRDRVGEKPLVLIFGSYT